MTSYWEEPFIPNSNVSSEQKAIDSQIKILEKICMIGEETCVGEVAQMVNKVVQRNYASQA